MQAVAELRKMLSSHIFSSCTFSSSSSSYFPPPIYSPPLLPPLSSWPYLFFFLQMHSTPRESHLRGLFAAIMTLYALVASIAWLFSVSVLVSACLCLSVSLCLSVYLSHYLSVFLSCLLVLPFLIFIGPPVHSSSLCHPRDLAQHQSPRPQTQSYVRAMDCDDPSVRLTQGW